MSTIGPGETSEVGTRSTPRRPWPVLSALGLDRPELRAWALYDWANSAMVTTIVAAVFPIYFSKVAAADLPEPVATQRFAFASTIGMLIIAVLAPILGALADARPLKKMLLGLFLAVGVVSVAAMFFIGRGDWKLAATLFILANVGASGSFVFYDALLPHLARDDEIDRVSTAGYALGYIGGGILLIANLLWIQKPEWFGLPSGPDLTAAQATLPARLAFLSVAVWWLVFALPLFFKVPEPPANGATIPAGRGMAKAAFLQMIQTFKELRKYPQGLLMLLAFLIYNDGIGTIYRMATIYGTEIGIDAGSLMTALVVVQFVGVPCAFAFGLLAGKIGAKASILLALAVYVGISIYGAFIETGAQFFAMAILVGTVQGGSQALSRSLFASMIPRRKSGEFFGFFAVAEKFAGMFAALVFALASAWADSSRLAILTVIAFFIVGAALLWKVDVAEGQRQARSDEHPA